MVRTFRHASARLRAEEGAFLVEVMITCLVLAVASVSLLKVMNASGKASGIERQRSVAADLAQTKLDELRGSSYETLRMLGTVVDPVRTIGGTAYTVKTVATQHPATESSTECTASRGRDLVQLETSVSWTGMGSVKPVRVDTFVAAPVGGSGAVRASVVDRNGKGVPDATVSSGGRVATTDLNGCALLYLTPGQHEITARKLDHIAPSGTDAPKAAATVEAEKTATVSFTLDRPGGVKLRFRYWRPGEPTTTHHTGGDPKRLSINNSGMELPTRVAIDSLAADGTLVVKGLFPFTGQYSFWAGGCDDRIPPLPNPGFVVTPGVIPTTSVDVNLYPLNISVRNGSLSTFPGDMRIRVQNTTCEPGVTWTPDIIPLPTNANRRTIAQNGFPYGGGYRVCVSSASQSRYHLVSNLSTATIASNGTWPPNAGTATELNLQTSTGSNCPGFP